MSLLATTIPCNNQSLIKLFEEKTSLSERGSFAVTVMEENTPFIVENFINLSLNEMTLGQHVDFISRLVSRKNDSLGDIIKNPRKWRLFEIKPEERLTIIACLLKNNTGLITATCRLNNLKVFEASHKARTAWMHALIDLGGYKPFLETLDQRLISEMSIKDRLALAYYICKSGSRGANWVSTYFPKFQLNDSTLKERVTLVLHLIANGKEGIAARNIARSFDTLNLSTAPLHWRLQIANCIIDHSGASPLAANMDRFMLENEPLAVRLALGNRIIDHGGASAIADQFAKFVLGASVKTKMTFARRIIDSGPSSARNFIEDNQTLGLEGVPLHERIALATRLIDQCPSAVAGYFEKLCLYEATIQQRLDLINHIIDSGSSSAAYTAMYFHKFRLTEATQKEHLMLVDKILNQAPSYLAQFIGQFKLDKATTEERLGLAKHLIAKGAAIELAKNLEKLHLHTTSDEERLGLAEDMINRGEQAAQAVAENFEKFSLDTTENKIRINLARRILDNGACAARSLAANFDKLKIEDVDLRLEFANRIIGSSIGAGAVAKHVDKFMLEAIPVEQTYALVCNILGAWSAYSTSEAITANFAVLKLQNSPVKQRLELINRLIKNCSDCVPPHLEKFGMDDLSFEERLELFQNLLGRETYNLMTHFEKFKFQDISQEQLQQLLDVVKDIKKVDLKIFSNNFNTKILNFLSIACASEQTAPLVTLNNKVAKRTATILHSKGFVEDEKRNFGHDLRDGKTISAVQGTLAFCKKIVTHTAEHPEVLSLAYLRSQSNKNRPLFRQLQYRRLSHIFGLKGEFEGFNETFTIPMLTSTWMDFTTTKVSKEDPSTAKIYVHVKKALQDALYNDNASEENIQATLKKINDPTYEYPILVASGWDWHLTTLIFYKGYFLYCNRGCDSNNSPGIDIFMYSKPMTPELLRKIVHRQEYTRNNYACKSYIAKELAATNIYHDRMKPQPVGNCTYHSSKTAILGLLTICHRAENAMASFAESFMAMRGGHYKPFLQFDAKQAVKDLLIDLHPDNLPTLTQDERRTLLHIKAQLESKMLYWHLSKAPHAKIPCEKLIDR